MRALPIRQLGFTLIELISVLVILGVVAALGSNFVVSTVDSYNTVQERAKIINRGRLVIEQITRQLRIALPNSVRVSGSGNCIEFLPIVAGASYLDDVPDAENFAAASSTIATAPYTLAFGSVNHVAVGALSQGEIYSTGSLNGRASVAGLGAGPPFTAINLTGTHRFIRNSINRRAYLTDNPQRFCVIGTTLFRYSNYGLLTTALTDLNPGGNTAIMAENVSPAGQAFFLSVGSEDFNATVDVAMDFTQGSNTVTLRQQVFIRNVP